MIQKLNIGFIMQIFFLTFVVLFSACSADEASTRGKFASTDATISDPDSGGGDPTDGEISNDDGGSDGIGDSTPTLTTSDLFLFLADDLKGTIDSTLAGISSDELRIAIKEDLGDNGLTAQLIPVFMTYADLDGSGSLSFTEFLNASIEKDGQEDAVKTVVESDKQSVFNFVDAVNSANQDSLLDAADILTLVQIRVWKIRTWNVEAAAGDPDRLTLLVKTGFDDLQTLVGTTYTAGALSAADVESLSTELKANLPN